MMCLTREVTEAAAASVFLAAHKSLSGATITAQQLRLGGGDGVMR